MRPAQLRHYLNKTNYSRHICRVNEWSLADQTNTQWRKERERRKRRNSTCHTPFSLRWWYKLILTVMPTNHSSSPTPPLSRSHFIFRLSSFFPSTLPFLFVFGRFCHHYVRIMKHSFLALFLVLHNLWAANNKREQVIVSVLLFYQWLHSTFQSAFVGWVFFRSKDLFIIVWL